MTTLEPVFDDHTCGFKLVVGLRTVEICEFLFKIPELAELVLSPLGIFHAFNRHEVRLEAIRFVVNGSFCRIGIRKVGRIAEFGTAGTKHGDAGGRAGHHTAEKS